jgi:hypothetical protein
MAFFKFTVNRPLGVILFALPTVLSASLLASHYNGNVYGLALTTSGSSGSLAIKQTLRTGAAMPSWLTINSDTGDLWVTDESTYGSPMMTQLSVSADGSIKTVATARTSGGAVHSCLYGGVDGKGFLAAAE